MNETQAKPSRVERICLNNECAEKWSKLPEEIMKQARDFIYCPFCSEEMNLHCSVCQEPLSNKDFRFCPWCGCRFEE